MTIFPLSQVLERQLPWPRVLGLLLLWRLLWLGGVLLAVYLWPGAYAPQGFAANFHWNAEPAAGLARHFETWDAQSYWFLAQNGYGAAVGTKAGAFYPLWPTLMAGAGFLGLGPDGQQVLWGGVLLSNILAALALTVVYLAVAQRFGPAPAARTLLLFLVFPGALFFGFAYTESLFLLLCASLLYGLDKLTKISALEPGGQLEASGAQESGRKNTALWLAAVGLCAFLAPLCRPPGLFLVLPLALWWWRHGKEVGGSRVRLCWLPWLPVLGFIAYLGLMHLLSGEMFLGFQAQQLYKNKPDSSRLWDLPAFVMAFLNIGAWHGFWNSALDRAVFVVFLATLWPLWRRSRLWFVFALPLGLMPAMTVAFMSFTRYALIVFPCFVVAALWWEAPQRARCFILVLGGLFAVQVALTWRHLNWHWAG